MNGDPEAPFDLDPQLAADTVHIADWPLCRLLLMDDARFPWLLLVPRRAGMVELDDLDGEGRTRLMQEIAAAMRALRAVAACDKINIGALGNLVGQLHVHVVARRHGDAAWPGPVWGSGAPRRYIAATRTTLVTRLQAAAAQP